MGQSLDLTMRTHQNNFEPRELLQNNLVIISKNSQDGTSLSETDELLQTEGRQGQGHGWLRTRSFVTKDAVRTPGKARWGVGAGR